MQRKVIISCAVTGSADSPGKNPAVPVTPEQIANSCIDAAKAGAAIVHIHVRDPKTTKPSMDGALYREVVERIRGERHRRADQPHHRPGRALRARPRRPDARPAPPRPCAGPTDRVRHVQELRPDICSLDMGSLNMGNRVFINTPAASADHGGRDPRGRRAAGARGVRDRPPAARQEIHRARPREGRRACSRSASASPGASRRRRRP